MHLRPGLGCKRILSYLEPREPTWWLENVANSAPKFLSWIWGATSRRGRKKKGEQGRRRKESEGTGENTLPRNKFLVLALIMSFDHRFANLRRGRSTSTVTVSSVSTLFSLTVMYLKSFNFSNTIQLIARFCTFSFARDLGPNSVCRALGAISFLRQI